MDYLRVRNWERFQHYKDRNPPWIKLHTGLLEDYEFSQLEAAERWQVIGMWILAAKLNNRIPKDPAYLQRFLNTDEPPDLDRLHALGMIEDADDQEWRSPWASRYISNDLRSKVLRRDGNRCTSCAATENLEIDHVIPVSKGGESAEENLQTLCRSCNRRKRTKSSATNTGESAEQVATQTIDSLYSEERRDREETKKRERRGSAEGEKKSRKRSLTLFPEDFQLNEVMQAYATTRLPRVDVVEVFQQFRDHHLTKGKTSKDWSASWRTWVGNCNRFGYPMIAVAAERKAQIRFDANGRQIDAG